MAVSKYWSLQTLVTWYCAQVSSIYSHWNEDGLYFLYYYWEAAAGARENASYIFIATSLDSDPPISLRGINDGDDTCIPVLPLSSI